MISRFITAFITLVIFYSCTAIAFDGNLRTNPVLADSLRRSPVAIQVGGDSLFLKASVWRDFMPLGNGETGIICSNQLIYKDSLPISTGLEFKTQYVINENQVWTNRNPAVYSDEPYSITGTIDYGPKWDPGIFVDVVCEFEIDGKTYRIIQKHQKIEAVY